MSVYFDGQSKILPHSQENSQWQNFIAKLQLKFGQEIFNKWLNKLELYSLSQHELIMSVNSKFIRDWIKREYLESGIKTLLLEEFPNLKKILIICVEAKPSIASKEKISLDNSEQSPANNVANLSKYDNVFAFGTNLNPKFTFDNFVESSSNKLAFSACKIIAGEQNEAIKIDDVNPLFLYGAVGLGKTHLGQAIAWQTKAENKKIRAIYLSAERFMHQFVQSIRSKDVVDFKEKFRSIDLLIIDDLQFISGKEGTGEELLYTISSLVEDGKRVVLICDRSPGDLNNISEKLKSKISSGMAVEFHSPDYQTRLKILQFISKNIANNEEIQDVLELLASKINSNIRDLEGALKKLVANQIFTGEPINIKSANNLLKDLFRSAGNVVTICDIKKQVASHFMINIKDLESANRARKFARPRQVAMYFCKLLTTKSLPDIGNSFGGKNHATVIHSVKNIEKLILIDIEFANLVRSIESSLTS